MIKKREFLKRLGYLGVAAALPAMPVWAQQGYPTGPIRFIVPFPPGGVSDTIVRSIGAHISKTMGQPVIVDNRPGAGGNLGLQLASKSPADGYTIVLGATATLSVSPYLYKNLPFDARKDFTPVAMVATIQNVLVVNKSLPVNNFAEFVAYLKAHPGKVNFASPGSGNSSHLAGEMFKRRMGVDIRHVPYKGDSPAMTDLIGGHVQMMFATVATAFPHIQSGALKPLVIAGPDRSSAIPKVPTMPEVGIDNLNADAWFGIVAPTGTPPAIVAKLNKEINAALSAPEVETKLTSLGLRPASMSVTAFGEMMQRESAKWGELVQASGASVD
jgi:tripartite-type tricarboxylate transporter receptor subunit TctC